MCVRVCLHAIVWVWLHFPGITQVINVRRLWQGQRQKRLEERQKRLEREDDERKKIDIEEALFQAEKRKAAIEKAKLQQYYQTDRVKGLHVSAYDILL